MPAAASLNNSQKRIFIDIVGETDTNNIVQSIQDAADGAAEWAAIEEFVAGDSTASPPVLAAKEIGASITDMPPLKGEPNNIEEYVYNGTNQGVSRPGPHQPNTITINIARFNRANDIHKDLEDADGKETAVSLAVIGISDADGTSVANATNATARCIYGNINSSRVINGPAEDHDQLELVIGVEKVSKAVDQA